MTLFESIIEERNKSMKDKFRRTILNTLISESQRIPPVTKTPDDKQVRSAIRKIHDGNIEIGSEESLKENEVLDEFKQVMMTETELNIEIAAIRFAKSYDGGIKDMGNLMKDLSAAFPGRYDGKMASEIAKTILMAKKL